MKIKMVSVAMMGLLVVSGLLSVAARADMAAAINGGDRDATGTRRALLVGINEYDPVYGPSPLSACVSDALGVRDTILLADPGQRWSAANLQILTNRLATASAIRTALQSLAATSPSGDLVLYYHSSHGGQYSGTSVYLCAYNQDYSAVSLGQDLALFNSGVTVIVAVDACHSGGLFKGKDDWPFAEMVMRSYLEAKTQQYRSRGLAVPKDLGNNIAFMTACDYNQLSQEQGSHGLYTGGLINGCLNADVDVNRDGLYQFSELHNYAAQVASAQNPDQTAQQFHTTVLTSMVARTVSSSISTNRIEGDFDCDGHADPYTTVNSLWYIWFSGSGYQLAGGPFDFGVAGTRVAADFDGDRRADPAMVVNSLWYIWFSGAGYQLAGGPWDFGVAGTPTAADFDGDHKADPAMVSASGGWYIWFSGAGYQLAGGPWDFGVAGVPAAGDFDGDRKADPAIVVNSLWYIWFSGAGYQLAGGPWNFGVAGAPVAGDFDGDRKADPAMVVNNSWTIWMSSGGYAPQGPFPFSP